MSTKELLPKKFPKKARVMKMSRMTTVTVRFELVQEPKSSVTATVWLATRENDRASQKLLVSSGDRKGVLNIENEYIARDMLDLVVEFDQEDLNLGRIRVPLGHCSSAERLRLSNMELRCPLGDSVLHARVSKGAASLVHMNSADQLECGNTRFKSDYEDQLEWLESLRDLAWDWQTWSGANIFLYYFEPAFEIAKEGYFKQEQIPWLKGEIENLVSGPGIVYAVHVNIAASVFYGFVLFVFGFAILPGCVDRNKWKIVPAPATFYIFYVVTVFLKFYCELAVMGCVLSVKVLGGGVPSLPYPFRCQKWSLQGWLAMKALGSFAAGLDVFSSSVFMARVVAQESLMHGRHWTMEDPWLVSLQSSKSWAWSVIYRAIGGYPTFRLMVFVLWLIVLFEILWALAYSLPVSKEVQPSHRKEQRVKYDFRFIHSRGANEDTAEVKKKDETSMQRLRQKVLCAFDMCSTGKKRAAQMQKRFKKEEKCLDYAEYHTPLIQYQCHGRALIALLKSSRLSMGQAMDTEYVLSMAKHWKPKEVFDYQRQSGHFFMIFMAQRVLTISLQASFLGISKNLNPSSSADWLTFMNVLLGCALGFATIWSEMSLNFKLAMQVWHGHKAVAIGGSKGMPFGKRMKEQLWWQRCWSALSLAITSSFALFSLRCLLYCLKKAWAAFFTCECGMMNVARGGALFVSAECVLFNGTLCTMSNWTSPPDNVTMYIPDPFKVTPGSWTNSTVCWALRLQ